MTPSSRAKKIPVTCDPHGHLERRPLADLTPFQGGFKDLDDARYAKLKASILAEGFMAPVFVWKDLILDGHQRTTVLEREGWDVEGDVPVVEIEADDEAGAARKLLKLTSAYGKPQTEGVFDFMQTHDLDLGDFADVDLPDFDEGELEVLFGEDGEGLGGDPDPYTWAVDSPVYKPTGEKPAVSDLYDDATARRLKSEIVTADIPEEVAEFLRQSADRHVVFNFRKIAEYYAHAEPEIQALMEQSALVIIDFAQAVDRGFVRLTERIADVYQQDHADA